MHHVADAVHVDDDEVLAVAVDDALELADHRAPPSAARSRDDAHASPRSRARRRRPRTADRPWAAARRSSGGSAPSRRGRRRRSSSSPGWARIRRRCTPAFAGTSSAMPRACPSLSVAVASRLTKVASTAASSGRNSSTIARQPVMDRDEPLGERSAARWSRPSRRPRRSAGCPRSRSGPSRCGGGPDRCRGCESPVPSRPVDSTSRRTPARRSSRGRPRPDALRAWLRTGVHLTPRDRSPRPPRPSRPSPPTRALPLALGISVLSGRGARLLGFRLGADLHAADERDLRAARSAAATFLLIDFVTGIVFSIGVLAAGGVARGRAARHRGGHRGAVRHADPAICRSDRTCAGPWRRWCW